MLKIDVSINGSPVPRLSLKKEVQWVISRVHGNVIFSSFDSREMSGSGDEHCWRLCDCYFTSGVNKFGVLLSSSVKRKRKGKGGKVKMTVNQS